MADLKAKVTFLADTKGLIKGVDAVEGKFSKLGRSLQTHSGTFLRAGAALGAAIGGLAAQGIAYGTTIDRMAESTGQAHEEMSRLAYSAELYHGDAQKVEKGTRRLAKAMSDASDGMATYQRAFDKTGISATDTEGNLRSVNDVLLDLADYMSSGANETEKMAVAQDLLGGRQSELIPWLKQGSAAIREQFEEADKLGLALSGDLAKRMEGLGTSVKKIRIAMRGVGVVVADVVLPVVEDLAFKAVAAMMAFQSWDPWVKSATVKLAGLGSAGLLALFAIGKFKDLGIGAMLKSWGGKLAGVASWFGVLGGMAATVGVGSAVALGMAEKATRLLEDETNALHGEYTRLLERQEEYNEEVRKGTYSDDMLTQAHIALAQEFQNLQQRALDAAGGMEDTSEEADALAAFMDKIKTAFDEAAGSVEEAQTPFERFTEVEELLSAAIADSTRGLEAQREAMLSAKITVSELNENLGYTNEQMILLPDPEVSFGEAWLTAGYMAGEGFANINESLADMEQHLNQALPDASRSMVRAFGKTYSELGKLDKMTWKTMKKAAAQGFKSMLDMLIDATLGELMATQIAETAKLGMKAFSNPAALAYIGVIAALYGTAKAAVGSINSFDESAVITRGGSMTGAFSIGDTIVSPEAMKNFMKGEGGGKTVTVSVNFNGSYAGGEGEFRDDIDYLREQIELAMES